MKKFLAILVLGLLWCSNAYAGWTYLKYKEVYLENRNSAQSYLWGVMTGYRVANAALPENQKHYCIPENFKLTLQNVEDIVEEAAKKIDEPDTQWIAIIYHWGMQDTFPCK